MSFRPNPAQALALALLCLVPAVPGVCGTGKPRADVSLISESIRYEPGRPIRVAFRFKIKPGWHTYWTNPGTAGEPARVAWDLPKGWKAEGLRFPVPDRFGEGELVVFGYEKEVTLLDTLVPPEGEPPRIAEMTARLSWLVCKDVCVGEEKSFRLSLKPVRLGSSVPALFSEAEKDIPLDDPHLEPLLRKTALMRWVLETRVPPGFDPTMETAFIPGNPQGVDFSREIKGEKRGDRLRFPLSIERNLLERGRVEGIIRQKGQRGGWLVSAHPSVNVWGWVWFLGVLSLGWVVIRRYKLKGRGK